MTTQESVENFKRWMIDVNGMHEKGSAYYYSRELIDVSKHYLEEVGSLVHIYDVADIQIIRNLANIYSRTGKYQDFVQIRHYGSVISKYMRYAEFCLKNPGRYAEFHEIPVRKFRY